MDVDSSRPLPLRDYRRRIGRLPMRRGSSQLEIGDPVSRSSPLHHIAKSPRNFARRADREAVLTGRFYRRDRERKWCPNLRPVVRAERRATLPPNSVGRRSRSRTYGTDRADAERVERRLGRDLGYQPVRASKRGKRINGWSRGRLGRTVGAASDAVDERVRQFGRGGAGQEREKALQILRSAGPSL